MNNKTPIFIWILILILSVYYSVTHINLETNILQLLPKYDSKLTSDLIDRSASIINDKLIIVVANESKQQAKESFVQALTNIKKSEVFAEVKDSIDSNQYQLFYQKLLKYRYLVMSKNDQEALANANNVNYFIDMAKAQLYGPTSFSKNQLKTDPLFFFYNYINQLSDFNQQKIITDEDQFYLYKNGRHHYLAFIQLKDSAFSPHYQSQVTEIIDAAKKAVSDKNGKFFALGSILFAQQAYLQAKNEISIVGSGSLIGICLLFLLTFRSLRPLIVSLVCMTLGLTFAFCITLLVFKKIHLFALVFGSTIAGVSIDYCFHYICESAINQSKNTIKHILPGLIIGFSSSAMVYIGFIITGYPVLAQISVFSILALLAVLINVTLFFPLINTHKNTNYSAIIQNISKKLVNNKLALSLGSLWKIVMLFIAVFVLNLMFFKPNDNVRDLQSLSPHLKKDEGYVRDLLSLKNNSRYALIHAKNIDQLLQKESVFVNQLRNENYKIVGVSDFIPTLKQQKENHEFYNNIYNSIEFTDYITNIGLDANIPMFQNQQLSENRTINASIFANETIRNIFAQRWLGKVDGVYALMVPIDGQWIVPTNNQVVIVQQAEDASKLFSDFRGKAEVVLILSVFILILILTIFRYKFKQAIQLVLLPFSAGLIALLLSQLLGVHISLFSILALLLILGMGLDYVVFLIESNKATDVTFALLLSSITTVLSFGLLSFSDVAVIKSFGLTVAIGILIILFISPAILNSKDK